MFGGNYKTIVCRTKRNQINRYLEQRQENILTVNLESWPCLMPLVLNLVHVQCSSDMSEPKYTRNARQPNMRIRVCTYARARMHIHTYTYTVYTRMPHWYV